jgi:hypothetical protein
VHDNAGHDEVRQVAVPRPSEHASDDERQREQHLHDLSAVERPEPPAQRAHAPVAERLERQRLLRGEPAVEALPRLLELVEVERHVGHAKGLQALAKPLLEAMDLGGDVGLGQAEHGGDVAMAGVIEIEQDQRAIERVEMPDRGGEGADAFCRDRIEGRRLRVVDVGGRAAPSPAAAGACVRTHEIATLRATRYSQVPNGRAASYEG